MPKIPPLISEKRQNFNSGLRALNSLLFPLNHIVWDLLHVGARVIAEEDT